jgi:coenzyme F420-0:L-glutamate ligase/coenzyme F420-1:gamma-L-glutamate ligase
MSELVLRALSGVPEISRGNNLAQVSQIALAASGLSLHEGDVLIFAQKIISKAEGRQVDLASVQPSSRATDLAIATGKDPRLVELILSESTEVLRVRPGVLIVEHRLGFVMANAGIDQSNVPGDGREMALLLPRDPDRSCLNLRTTLRAHAQVDIAVMIIDSIGRAWRQGTTGHAIGVSGLPALLDLCGAPDRTGRLLQSSELGLADELAAAASLVMGQANEGRPIVLARGVPYARREGSVRELLRPREKDLFR